MARRNQLVLQHLEDISWRVLQDDREVIQDQIRGQAGIYALYKQSKLYYVGLASNLMGRLKTHLKDHHSGEWDRFSVYLVVRDTHIKELESLVLRIVKPGGNRHRGQFVASENLRPALQRQMRRRDADRRARLLGGPVAERNRRTRASKTKGRRALAEAFDRRIRLRGWTRHRQFDATLRRDGWIRYKDYLYNSPSAAARAATGRPTAGWSFWYYLDPKSGDWIQLRDLRRNIRRARP